MDVILLVTKNDGDVKEIKVENDVTTMGRGKDCDLRIPIESCSRAHCELRKQDDQLLIKDLNSANGTFVNNERIDEATLSAGDQITIGPVVMTVQIDGEPAEPHVPTYNDNDEELIPSHDGAHEGDAGGDHSFIGLGDSSDADFGLGDLGGEDDGENDEDPISALEALAELQDEDEDQ